MRLLVKNFHPANLSRPIGHRRNTGVTRTIGAAIPSHFASDRRAEFSRSAKTEAFVPCQGSVGYAFFPAVNHKLNLRAPQPEIRRCALSALLAGVPVLLALQCWKFWAVLLVVGTIAVEACQPQQIGLQCTGLAYPQSVCTIQPKRPEAALQVPAWLAWAFREEPPSSVGVRGRDRFASCCVARSYWNNMALRSRFTERWCLSYSR